MGRVGAWFIGVTMTAAALGCAAVLWLAGVWVWAVYVPIHFGYGLFQYARLRREEGDRAFGTPADYVLSVLISSLVVLVALALHIYDSSLAG